MPDVHRKKEGEVSDLRITKSCENVKLPLEVNTTQNIQFLNTNMSNQRMLQQVAMYVCIYIVCAQPRR